MLTSVGDPARETHQRPGRGGDSFLAGRKPEVPSEIILIQEDDVGGAIDLSGFVESTWGKGRHVAAPDTDLYLRVLGLALQGLCCEIQKFHEWVELNVAFDDLFHLARVEGSPVGSSPIGTFAMINQVAEQHALVFLDEFPVNLDCLVEPWVLAPTEVVILDAPAAAPIDVRPKEVEGEVLAIKAWKGVRCSTESEFHPPPAESPDALLEGFS